MSEKAEDAIVAVVEAYITATRDMEPRERAQAAQSLWVFFNNMAHEETKRASS